MNLVRDNQSYYAYVLRSKKDNIWYTGFTADLRKRFKEHNANIIGWTKGRGPFELIYGEFCKNIADARSQENTSNQAWASVI